MKETMKINQTICVTTTIGKKDLQTSPGIMIWSKGDDNFDTYKEILASFIERP